MAIIPILQTPRLRLRAHRPEDFPACAALWVDPDVVRHITGKPLTAEDVWSRMLRYVGHWEWLGYGYWALEEKATGLFAGELGFADYQRETEPSFAGTPELGYVLASRLHGKGYATEALGAVLAWSDANFEQRRTVCIVSPENIASSRLAQKVGYREYQRGTYKGHPTAMMERL